MTTYTPYIIPAIAIIVLYALAKILNKKGIVSTYNKISGSKYLALAAVFILFAIPTFNKQSVIDRLITAGLVAALVAYFIYKYFKTRKATQ